MDCNLRIAVVTETWPPEVNGVARTIATMVRGALARGDCVELIRPQQRRHPGTGNTPPLLEMALAAGDAASGAASPRLREVLTPSLPLPGYPGLRFGLPVRSRLLTRWQRQRPDIVQVVTEGPLGWAAVSAARALGIPVVSEYHTNFHAYSRHYGAGRLARLITGYLRYLHNRADCTLVPTAELSSTLRAQGYRRVEVVARGVDGAIFGPQHRRTALRAEWGVGPEALVLTYVGRLAREKNLDLLMRTYRALRVRHPDVRLVLVGDGPLRAELEDQHPECIFAGMRHGTDLAAHYASADLFLFPSLTETFGNVVSEALACGVPVVAFRCAAAAELIRPGVNGALAHVGDEEDYLRVARELVADLRATPIREQMRRAAVTSVAHLSWAAIHQRMQGLLQRFATPTPPALRRAPTSVAGLPT